MEVVESNDVYRLDTFTSSLTNCFINTANTDIPFLLKKTKLTRLGAVVVVIVW